MRGESFPGCLMEGVVAADVVMVFSLVLFF